MAKPLSAYNTQSTEQSIQNRSFDEEFDVSMTEGLGYDGANLLRNEADDIQSYMVKTSDYLYICKSAIGTPLSTAKWKVLRITLSGANIGSRMYADGDSNFDNVATDPTTLNYVYS